MTPAELALLRDLVKSGDARRIRDRLRLSIGETARALGVSRATVVSWDRGRALPAAPAAKRYLELLEEAAALLAPGAVA